MAGGSRLDREEGVELLWTTGARSASDTNPSSVPLDWMGSRRIFFSAMSCVACWRSQSGPPVSTRVCITSRTRVSPGTFPLATTDSVMSRSVRMPLRLPPSVIKTHPTLWRSIFFAASITESVGAHVTRSGARFMISLIRMCFTSFHT